MNLLMAQYLHLQSGWVVGTLLLLLWRAVSVPCLLARTDPLNRQEYCLENVAHA